MTKITLIRLFIKQTLILRWMGLGLGQPRVLSPINAVVFFLAARLHPPCLTLLPNPFSRWGFRCLRDQYRWRLSGWHFVILLI